MWYKQFKEIYGVLNFWQIISVLCDSGNKWHLECGQIEYIQIYTLPISGYRFYFCFWGENSCI